MKHPLRCMIGAGLFCLAAARVVGAGALGDWSVTVLTAAGNPVEVSRGSSSPVRLLPSAPPEASPEDNKTTIVGSGIIGVGAPRFVLRITAAADGKLAAEVVNPSTVSAAPIRVLDLKLAGDVLSFTVVTDNGSRGQWQAKYEGRMAGNSIAGTLETTITGGRIPPRGGQATMRWKAERNGPADPAADKAGKR